MNHFNDPIIQEDFRSPIKINGKSRPFLNPELSKDNTKVIERTVYSYSKIVSADDWGLLEIIPNKVEHKNPTDIIKIFEEDREDIKTKNPKLIDANSQIRKNVLKGFGSK